MRSRLWRNGNFLRLWSAQTVSELGSQVTLIALPLAAIGPLHATTFEVAALATLEFAPFLVFGLPAGVWVDRLSHRRLLVLSDLGRGVLLVSVPVAYELGHLTLVQLFVVAFASGTLTIFFSVAYQAYLPSILTPDEYVDGNSKLEVTRSLAHTAGPGAGGGLVALTSAPGAVLADAISFFASALLILSINAREVRERVHAPRESLRHELREGVRFLADNPYIRAGVVSAGIINFAYGIVWAVLLLFAVRTLHLGAAVIGGVLAIGQFGGVVGALAAKRIARVIGVGWTMIGATMLVGPAWLMLGFASRGAAVPVLAAGWALGSFAAVITAVIGPSVRMSIVPQRLMGRVLATNRVVIWGVAPLGSLAGGALASVAGLRTALIVGGAISFAGTPPTLFSPWRSLRELPSPPDEE